MQKMLDSNNIRALSVINLLILAIENGCEDIEVVEVLEVVRDCLEQNNRIFDKIS